PSCHVFTAICSLHSGTKFTDFSKPAPNATIIGAAPVFFRNLAARATQGTPSKSTIVALGCPILLPLPAARTSPAISAMPQILYSTWNHCQIRKYNCFQSGGAYLCIGVLKSLSRFPEPPHLLAIISAAIEIAVSSGVRPPRSKPTGEDKRFSASSSTPAAR